VDLAVRRPEQDLSFRERGFKLGPTGDSHRQELQLRATWVPTSGERLWDRIPQADWGERDIDELSSPSLARWGE
jgi:hypothetical protein